MKTQVENIIEVLELASRSRLPFEEAEQQIRRIPADGEAKTCALRSLSEARTVRDNSAGKPAAERLKVTRQIGTALTDTASRLKESARV